MPSPFDCALQVVPRLQYRVLDQRAGWEDGAAVENRQRAVREGELAQLSEAGREAVAQGPPNPWRRRVCVLQHGQLRCSRYLRLVGKPPPKPQTAACVHSLTCLVVVLPTVPTAGVATIATRHCVDTSTTLATSWVASMMASVATATTAPASRRPPCCSPSLKMTPLARRATWAAIAPVRTPLVWLYR